MPLIVSAVASADCILTWTPDQTFEAMLETPLRNCGRKKTRQERVCFAAKKNANQLTGRVGRIERGEIRHLKTQARAHGLELRVAVILALYVGQLHVRAQA